jgi:hypothetical protein
VRVRVEQLVDELKALRKGRGILASSIANRVGTALRTVTGTLGTDPAADVRRKVGGSLRRWAEDLPADLRVAVLVAFALDDDGRLPYYKDRVHLVADQLGRDERTARRRIDEGIERLAEVATAGAGEIEDRAIEPGAGWHTEHLLVTLALDQPAPEAFELRRIVSDRDRLEYVDLAMTLTSPPGRNGTVHTEDLEVDVFHGGRLVAKQMETADRFGFRLKLPKVLEREETHQIGLRVRVRQDRTMSPHYVCVPRNRCVEFELRVRFNVDSPPAGIWRLNNTFQRDIDDPLPTGDPLPLDAAGEIHTRFHELTPGLAYGIRWTPAQARENGTP